MNWTQPQAVETVLMAVRPQAAVMGLEHPAPGQPLTGPEPTQRRQLALRPDDRVVSLYHLTAGCAHLRFGRGETLALATGQLALALHESDHELHAGPRPGPGGRWAGACSLLAVHYAVDRLLLRSWDDALAPVLVLDLPPASRWVAEVLGGAARQAGEPGGQALATRIAEAALCEALRLALVEPRGNPLPVPVAADRVVTRCLALMHRQLDSPWTVERLATESGASRSLLAERFTRHIGASPMAYLQKLRLQWASQCLRTTSLSVSHVAAAVGYGTDAAFNRAFRREYGIPPGVWRRRGGAEAAGA